MDLSSEAVLITGGSQGIGRGLAERYAKAGARVLLTGRDPAKLADLAASHPSITTRLSDIGDPAQREALARDVRATLPGLTTVINNAGIQRRVSLADDVADWSERQREIDVLLSGPVHLNHLLIALLLAQPRPTRIVNVTSGGAYVPQVFAPLYSACKAALHSYTVTLRHALAGTGVRVIELAPPAVKTGLAPSPHGADLDAFCTAVFPDVAAGDRDLIGFGPTEHIGEMGPREVESAFAASAARATVRGYQVARGA